MKEIESGVKLAGNIEQNFNILNEALDNMTKFIENVSFNCENQEKMSVEAVKILKENTEDLSEVISDINKNIENINDLKKF